MLHGAKGVLTGRPAAVMNQLEDNSFDLVIDTQGGQVAYDAAKRILKDGGRYVPPATCDAIMLTSQNHHNGPT